VNAHAQPDWRSVSDSTPWASDACVADSPAATAAPYGYGSRR
jgi:hypothetical protein